MPATALSVTQAALAGPQKHRACDECRSRKIACSKEPNGCDRCLKDGHPCVYSAQKPMGRPRKRRHADTDGPSAVFSVRFPGSAPATAPSSQPASLLGSVPGFVSSFAPIPPALAAAASAPGVTPITAALPHSPSVSIAASTSTLPFSLFAAANHDESTLQLLGGAGHYHSQHHIHNAAAHHHNHHHNHHHSHQHSAPSQFPVSDLMGPSLQLDTLDLGDLGDLLLPEQSLASLDSIGMNPNVPATRLQPESRELFDSGVTSAMDLRQSDFFQGPDFGDASEAIAALPSGPDDYQQNWTAQYEQLPAPSDSSPSTHSSNCFESSDPISADTTPPEVESASAPCTCVSLITKAMTPLISLPSDTLSAIRVARDATGLAHDTLNCRQCYSGMYDLSKAVPASRVQSSVYLGVFIPAACNAYKSILAKIDRDAEQAKEDGRLMHFSLEKVGGILARFMTEGRACTSVDYARLKCCNNKALEPDDWRINMRAIIKVDVYGSNHLATFGWLNRCVPSHVSLYRGLNDVVLLLDERNNKRHDMADSLMQACYGHAAQPMSCQRRQQRHCVSMLDQARLALNSLVIS
ncbi:Zn2Cys6 transcriptional regulator [Trichoderma parareesei]|uniref:Zn2Cys6 transcriptional regulator n=1 Tax=Trichoderma parareesei TaxID=858221 RepID=A0A2H2ZF23_TRIPA|nr:Zn2Cys6 transcriptional regulator [Trichoderma parareesei]